MGTGCCRQLLEQNNPQVCYKRQLCNAVQRSLRGRDPNCLKGWKAAVHSGQICISWNGRTEGGRMRSVNCKRSDCQHNRCLVCSCHIYCESASKLQYHELIKPIIIRHDEALQVEDAEVRQDCTETAELMMQVLIDAASEMNRRSAMRTCTCTRSGLGCCSYKLTMTSYAFRRVKIAGASTFFLRMRCKLACNLRRS